MFEVGKSYRIKMRDGQTTHEYTAKAIEVSLPLVKFKDPAIAGGAEIIINTASLDFVSAREIE